MRGLYIHIPFCKYICSYCDFPKLVSKSSNHKTYIYELIKEIESYKDKLNDIDTVYIGGGTPNSLDLSLLEELLINIHSYLKNSKESTIELNSELITEDLAKLLIRYNISRVSIGVQTLDEKSINLLNRQHNKEIVKNSINLLREYGINNINIDLIFGIPYTDINTIKEDLDFILSLNPNHLSYYSLILEDRTIFSHLVAKNKLKLLDDDIIADMYDYINNRLEGFGYKHYEISNYAKPGYESIHNKLYWESKEYIGVGLGASGYIDSYRYTNYKDLKNYYEHKIEENIFIDENERKKEYLMLGLRLTDGVSISKYTSIFKSDIFTDFSLDKLIKNKLIMVDGDYIKICKDKLFIANLIFEEFVGD
ncbi:MAG: radical SAM family heme chaperone HemW [Acholeplasmatales bacterium]|nr:radical SAM family heme chaperone HemW [Acholeplasmatales bacterium]